MSRPISVYAVSSWGNACGIADYAQQLVENTAAVAPEIHLHTAAAARFLDPKELLLGASVLVPVGVNEPPDVVWLNHHDGLHSRWTARDVRQLQASGVKVVVTYHDTYAGTPDQPNSKKAHELCNDADAFIVHEPVEDLPGAILIRQGIHAGTGHYKWDQSRPGYTNRRRYAFQAYPHQPVLGTIGFNFPWKNFDRVAQVSAACGWALVILSNNATEEDEARWRGLNPNLLCIREFLPQDAAVSYLTGCDATIFAYECANSGTSGAIRQGIAARKPVIAWENCRQFRDLYGHTTGVHWCHGFDWLPAVLANTPIAPCHPGIVALAQHDSWTNAARRYAEIFHAVVER